MYFNSGLNACFKINNFSFYSSGEFPLPVRNVQLVFMWSSFTAAIIIMGTSHSIFRSSDKVVRFLTTGTKRGDKPTPPRI